MKTYKETPSNIELKPFTEIMDILSDYYRTSPLTAGSMKLYFSALCRYTEEEINSAILYHIKDTEEGNEYPKASHLIKHMNDDIEYN